MLVGLWWRILPSRYHQMILEELQSRSPHTIILSGAGPCTNDLFIAEQNDEFVRKYDYKTTADQRSAKDIADEYYLCRRTC